MFNLFKKKPEPKIINYLSLFWDPKEEMVFFDPFFRAAMEHDITVIGMRFVKSYSLTDNRHMITFKVLGTCGNLNDLQASIPKMDCIDVFRQKDQ